MEMLDLLATSTNIQAPLHVRVRQFLRQLLHEFSDGQRFYSERELIEKLNVSQITVRKAMVELANEGHLVALPRRGVFVRKNILKRHIGVMTPNYRLTGGVTMVETLANACRKEEIEIHAYYLHPEDSVDDAMKMIRNKSSDERIILLGLAGDFTRALVSRLHDDGYGHLIINYVPPGHMGRSVGVDEAMAFNLILDHLSELGHKDILFMVTEPAELMATIQRSAILEKQLKGYPHAKIVSCETKNWASSFDATYSKIGDVLRKKPWPTAICPLSGAGAWAVLRYCIEKGIKIPEEISLVCYDPLAGTELLPIPLTSLSFSAEELAQLAVDLLWSEENESFRKTIKPELIVRSSTGPAPRQERKAARSGSGRKAEKS